MSRVRLLPILLLWMWLTISACAAQRPAPAAPSETPRATETPALALATETPLPPAPTATTTRPPEVASASPTPPAVQLRVAGGVPAELASEAATLPPLTLAGAGDPRVMLVPGGGDPFATWVYALVAPFPTLVDDVSLGDVQAAWHSGALYTDPDTALMLTASWGTPLVAPPLVEAERLTAALWEAQGNDPSALVLAIVPFERLEPRLKLLQVDGQSPLAPGFDSARYPLALAVGLVGEPAAVAAVRAAWQGPLTNRDANRLTRLAMTGPAGMRRAVAERMDRYGITYPAEETGPVLQAADIAHMSNENAFATDCPVQTSTDSTHVCNRDEYFALMEWMGIDVNEMTGNHLNDWGARALLHTFDLYDAAGIGTFGGGRDLAHAREPLLREHNGNRVAFVGCNPVGPDFSWAAENRPGALPCGDYGDFKAEIARLRAAGYVVVATVQFREDYVYDARPDHQAVFQALATAGAHIVSGSQGHHPQGFGFHGDGIIHYGLGNLLADQMWSLGSRQMFIDTYTLYDGRVINLNLWTGLNEDYARVRAMTPTERADLLQNVFEASDW